MEQNPRILDLREKLNKIKNQEIDVSKTIAHMNNTKQETTVEKEQDESGPYSLLFDLQPDTSKSSNDITESNVWSRTDKEKSDNDEHSPNFNGCPESISKCVDRLPNVLNFQTVREFEYSCETEPKKIFNTHSRSDLCLQLKSHVNSRQFETNISPNDNSLNRNNEENSLDDSLGILTPDQMDDICYLEIAFSPTVEGLPIFCDNNDYKISPDNGDTPSTDKTESNSAASTIQNDAFESSICRKRTKDADGSFQAPLAVLDTINDEDQNIVASFDNHVVHHQDETIETDDVACDQKKKTLSTTLSGESVDKQLVTKMLEDEFMPSMHSSILEPVSSIAETTINLDLPLDCKPETRHIIQRIEQTPSPEDLPLDHSDISQFSASTLHDTVTDLSHSYSDVKNEYPKSMETSKVSNSFITSITSITSLDGYQGDGEMSRPVSRGADHSIELREDVMEMDWQNVPVARRADPMTDSDFFTESDADGLDDNIQRGDRRAQVIDGALYGGKNGNGNPPLIVNRNDDSCMESSGVYTDFENHRSSPFFLNVIDDLSPEGSTPSTRSECSQKYASNGKINTYFSPLNDTLKDDKSEESCIVDDGDTPKITSKRNSINSDKDIRVSDKIKEEKRFTLKKYKMPRRDVPSKLKTILSSRKSDADLSLLSSPKSIKKSDRRESLSKKNTVELKNCKVKPFKDIKSKIDCSLPLQRSQTACSVNRHLTSKSTNINNKPKSRHMRNIRSEMGSAAGSGKSSLHSSQSDISATSTPPGKHPTTRFPLLRNGKKRENASTPPNPRPPPVQPQTPPTQVKKNGVVQKLSSSPVSVRSRTSLAPPPSPRKPTPRRQPAQRPTTLPTNKESPRVTSAVAPRAKRAQTPQQARPPPAPLVASLPAPALLPAPRDDSAQLAHATKGFEALLVVVKYLVFQLDALNDGKWRVEADRWRGVAAAERTSAARADRDWQQRAKKDLDTIAECLGKISELEREVTVKEEENTRLQAVHIEEVSALANDIKDLKDTIECLKREVAESRTRLHAHSQIERTLRAQLEAVRAENELAKSSRESSPDTSYDKSYNTCDAACDPVHCEAEECQLRLNATENLELSSDASELAAEVLSLRAVIDLKQSEVAALRDARTELAAERERRAAAERESRAARHAAEELRERAAARQRDVDRLRDDNRRLREVATRDRDHATRMAALNEELRYKLRTKNQVVSLLANSGYIDRAGVRPRTLSGESGRSSPPLDSPPSPASPAPHADQAHSLPSVKGVVEKHDSVSWVLDIEESVEEKASRLARRPSFRAGSVPSGGVKRRGGGSPGSASPAPAPAPASPAAPNASKLFRPAELDFPPPQPPLKESAGEAIYIYDDRQY